jgi:hypothetical protein
LALAGEMLRRIEASELADAAAKAATATSAAA